MPEQVWPKWRWRVIHLLDKLNRYCWSELVDWSYYYDDEEPGRLRDLPSLDGQERCRQRANAEDGVGSCYCGKVGWASPRENAAIFEERAREDARWSRLTQSDAHPVIGSGSNG